MKSVMWSRYCWGSAFKVVKKGYQYIFAAQIVEPALEVKGIAIGAEQISRPFYPFTVMFKRLQKRLPRDPSFRSQ